MSAKCGFGKYLKDNILNVYEYAICFAAHESKRIANEKLKSLLVFENDGTVYAPIKEIAAYFGYESYSYRRCCGWFKGCG